MSNIPDSLQYTKTHEWAKLEKDGLVRTGISYFAQEQLGDVVYIELPEPGCQVLAGKPCAVIESVKAASDINSPVSGEIIEVNKALNDAPELVNQDCYAHWLFTVRPADLSELDTLLDASSYLAETEAA